RTGTGAVGEIQLTDALASSIVDTPLHAVTNPGLRFDCGSKLGMIEATITVALERPDLATEARAALIDVLERTQ
ncbi:MAG: UTP--glucose-1-phosphate uridylyltransferase, partial [Acidimicrobiia bacterium]|nr:UTP--glucose-1-phosphate uridylyltransferase [Acidimicrobiia bacterium]